MLINGRPTIVLVRLEVVNNLHNEQNSMSPQDVRPHHSTQYQQHKHANTATQYPHIYFLHDILKQETTELKILLQYYNRQSSVNVVHFR